MAKDRCDCGCPKSPPSAYSIAKHWGKQDLGWVYDLGEPSCFACGDYKLLLQGKSEPKSLAARWQKKHSGLERAHIVASSLGGCNHPSNLVMLCPECHQAAPMTSDPQDMIEWVSRGQEPGIVKLARECMHELRREKIEPFSFTLDEFCVAADDVGAGLHQYKLSVGTMMCVLKELAKRKGVA